VDYQSRSGVCPQTKARDRLIRLAVSHPAWALSFEDETWRSRLAQPALHARAPTQHPLPLIGQPVPPTDPDPKALACYGLLVQERTPQGVSQEHVWLRFVAARPVSAVTVAFLSWVCTQLTALGKTALLLVGDNASWHRGQALRQWLREHHQQVKREGHGIRIVRCPLPSKSPWLNPLEAHWGHGERAVVEPSRLLTATELTERVYAYFGCPHEKPLSLPQEVP
jgi:DDE superfamily endonuclease